MRILIAGAGEVGFLVASELYQEHDVTLIDKDPEACSRLAEMDVKILQGNAANVKLLIEAGIKQVDIVLAVTGNDEVNVIVCFVATHFGVVQTIARVSNPDYIDKPIQRRKEFGIDYMICPELVLAEQMAQALYFPSMLLNRNLAGGQLQLIEIRIKDNMPLIGRIADIEPHFACRILAVNHAGKISISTPSQNIVSGDHVILLCDSRAMAQLRIWLHETISPHKALIVGGGMGGFYLAERLEKGGFEVKLIEISQQRCHEIADRLSKTMIINGDGSDVSLLQQEGAADMDIVLGMTGVDEKNLLCSLLVKQLGAKKIFSRVNRMAYANLFELVGVDKAMSPGQVTADVVLQRVLGAEEVVTLGESDIELLDLIARENSKIIGKNLLNELPEQTVAGLVFRGGKLIIPSQRLFIEKGDRVFIMADPTAVPKIRKLFVV